MNFSRNLGLVSPQEQDFLGHVKIAIAGLGGDGGCVAETLARMGVRRFALADPEDFEPENLNRQNGCFVDTIGRNKAKVAADIILGVSPDAEVSVFTDGVTNENIGEFLDSVTLVVDETEFTTPEVAVMLARAARERDQTVVTGFNVGWGCLVTSFIPTGVTLERYLGLNESTPLEQIAQQSVSIGRWVPRLPAYANEKDFRKVSQGSVPIPSVSPGVALASGMVATEVFNHLVSRRSAIVAPRSIWVDAQERKMRVVRWPTVSFWLSLGRIVVRSRLGLNPQRGL